MLWAEKAQCILKMKLAWLTSCSLLSSSQIPNAPTIAVIIVIKLTNVSLITLKYDIVIKPNEIKIIEINETLLAVLITLPPFNKYSITQTNLYPKQIIKYLKKY